MRTLPFAFPSNVNLPLALVAMTSLVALAAACAAPTSEEEDPGAEQASESALVAQSVPNRSGTRLRARYARGSDGSQYLIGWFDTKLKVSCEVSGWTFGSMGVSLEPGRPHACRPSYPAVDGQSAQLAYADAACTRPVVVSVKEVPPRAYVEGNLFDLTKSSSAPLATGFLKDASGACVSVPVASDVGKLFFYDAKLVPDSEFVTFLADPRGP